MSALGKSWSAIRCNKFIKMMSAGTKSLRVKTGFCRRLEHYKKKSTTVTAKVVKSHIPLIKFRKGGKTTTPDTIHQKSDAVSQQTSASPVGYSLRGTGIDESQLPQRYLRKPMSQIEMETIERGGPE